MNSTRALILAIFIALALPIAVRIALALHQIRKLAARNARGLCPGETTSELNWNSPEPVGRRAPIPPSPPPPITLCICPQCGHHHRPSAKR